MNPQSSVSDEEIDPSDAGEYARLVRDGRIDDIDDTILEQLSLRPEHYGLG
jgi:hypothetical protein